MREMGSIDEKTVELMILEELNFKKHILIDANYNKFGLSGKAECLEILKKMKLKRLVRYDEDTHELFKGEPCGRIFVTELGKRYLHENK